MVERLLKKLNYIAGLLPIGALFGIIAFTANAEVKDFDLWLHIGVGEYIWTHGIIPAKDFLSCTIAGQPWNNHEWLFQIIVYNLFEYWGSHGVLMMQISVVIVTMLLLLFLGFNREKQITTIVSLTLVYFVFQQRFTTRPDLFSLLFFTIYIFILSLHIDKKWASPALFIVQVLWSNMHGFFFFGPLFVFIGIVAEWIRRHIKLPYEWNESGNLTDDEYARMKKIFLAVLVACLINPQTFEGALYPIKVFLSLSGDSQVFFKYILELKKPITSGDIFTKGPYVHYKLLIVLSGLSFIFNRRRIDISALMLWVVFLFFSLNAIRNLPFFAFAAYLAIITNTFGMDYKNIIPIRFSHKKFEYITLIFLKILILVWMLDFMQFVSARNYYDFENYKTKSEYGGVSLKSYSNKAVDFLIENDIKGNFFNDFNSGAYLIGRVFPNIKVFIDGRTEVYGAEFFKNYMKIWKQGDKDAFEKAVKDYHLTGAFINTINQRVKGPLAKYLYEHEEWKLVYFDYDALIFLKDVDVNKPIIDQYEIDLAQREVDKVDLMRLGPILVEPYQSYFRGHTLESLGFNDLALKESEEALKVAPSYAPVYEVLGKVYGKRKDHQKAFENFRLATAYSPSDKENRVNLALAYLSLKDYKNAIDQYKMIIQKWPDDPKGYFLIARAYMLKKDYDKALETIRKAHQMDPKGYVDIVMLGDIAFDDGQYLIAEKIYRIVQMANSQNSEIYVKLGDTYKAQNNPEAALVQFQRALALDSDNEDLKDKIRQLEKMISTPD